MKSNPNAPAMTSCRKSGIAVFATVLGVLFAAASLSAKADSATRTNAATAEADKAWKEVERASQPPPLPVEWAGQRPTEEQVEKFRVEQGRLAGVAAEKAKSFYTRFPDHAKAASARKKYQDMLQIAVKLGDTNRLADLEKMEAERLKDPNLPEDERLKLRMQMVNRALLVKRDEGGAAYIAEMEKAGNELLKEFPKRDDGYRLLLTVAANGNEVKARALAKKIIAGTDSEEIKTEAEALLCKLDAVGKPVEIKFTALDGRDVDVGKMKGKVVLIDFWATWCGPCVAEIPNVKKAYEALHPKGFEIVGISFDSDKQKLRNFVADKKMPWAQYFDGEGWSNKFGQQYGINSIPTMWLVDKKGVLREMNARAGLEDKVTELLAE